MAGAKAKKKTINLALQGGGAHGAFTWGVLDALAEDERIDIESISATSAGAMNAAVFAYGKSDGSDNKARAAMEDFWREVSRQGALYRPFHQNPISKFFSLEKNPFVDMAESLMGNFSPYQFNPLGINPLRDILEDIIDFSDIHKCEHVKLFITATNVRTGTPTVFQNEAMSIDVLMASSCLPQVFQAVEIDGENYWDGGYMGNPSLWPLFYHARCRDILLVHINPITRDELPKDMHAIENRLNEITFNSALLKEMRAIEFVQRLLGEDMLKDEYKDKYKKILLHAIRAEDVMTSLSAASKFNTDWNFLLSLKEKGRKQAQSWLKENFDKIGEEGTTDIATDYLGRL
ncbi:MAG: patatin-like phospholipase family protein [Micavibrio sp.]|nr:patatin-like phospholipase family protein [Micavibrio sp.]